MLKAVSLCILACVLSASLQADTPAEWTNRAEQLIRAGDTQAALAALSKAAASAPASAESEDRIGFLLAVLKRQSDAIEHFQKSISLDSRYPPAHYHLGAALWLANDRERALPELEEAVRLSPAVFDYRFRLGSAYLDSGDYAKAGSELKQAVTLDNSKPAAWQALGRALQHIPDLPAALDAYQHALALKPQDDSIHNEYALMLIETRQPDRGIEECQKILAHDPQMPPPWRISAMPT